MMGEARRRKLAALAGGRVPKALRLVRLTLLIPPDDPARPVDMARLLAAYEVERDSCRRAHQPEPAFSDFLVYGLMRLGMQVAATLRQQAEAQDRLIKLPEELRAQVPVARPNPLALAGLRR